MEAAVIAIYLLTYIAMAVLTYRTVYTLLINDLDYKDPKDRELLEDRKVIYLVVGVASMLWIIYVPYMVIMSIIDANKELHKF